MSPVRTTREASGAAANVASTAGRLMSVVRQRVLVLGGSGFVGRHLAAGLAAAGHDIVVITRRRERARHLLLLPTVEVVEGDPYDPAVLARHAAGATAAVNLVGTLHERGRQSFQRVHVELPGLMVAACKSAGVARVLHLSALGAGADAPSRYLQSKAAGEAAIAASGLAWTVFRPSVIFGPEDTFLNLFAKLAQFLPVIALAGANARFQPVYVGDVTACMVAALGDDETSGQRYDLCGPRVYTLEQLVRYVGEVVGARRPIVALGPALSSLQARVMEWLPGPLLTRDNLLSMQRDNVCDCPFPPRFGIAPSPIEATAPGWLAPASRISRFDPYREQSGR
jgi:uncharacterized protein YbjT (DUF2867 family)